MGMAAVRTGAPRLNRATGNERVVEMSETAVPDHKSVSVRRFPYIVPYVQGREDYEMIIYHF